MCIICFCVKQPPTYPYGGGYRLAGIYVLESEAFVR